MVKSYLKYFLLAFLGPYLGLGSKLVVIDLGIGLIKSSKSFEGCLDLEILYKVIGALFSFYS